MDKIIKQNMPNIIGLFGLYYLLSYFIDKSRLAIAPATLPIAKAIAGVTGFINGNHPIKYPTAGFFLNADKLDYTLKIKDLMWLKAMTLTHDDHEGFLNQIFDSDLRLKNEYRPLLNNLVDAETIAAAAKG
ncbi:hypothetical protein J5X91_17280 [Pseudoalteromonas sp. K222D]|uniref:hypothetical protein n=1 Tax=Pseudoalteromonas sp. K222D TaxID=2820756 RepID=UPI001AD7AA30|nr:hypothetical protein [Pseudoalteromonas sp. K222D]MBO7927996.1 hypothetical protein [Pseudoalteromonas sp. K222D]